MRKFLIFVLLATLFSVNLMSCDGGGGGSKGGEEFGVFDVSIYVTQDLSGCNLNSAIPGNELKLSLLIRETNISGTGELLAFGNKGDAEKVRGRSENDSLSLKPFQVSVASDTPPEDTIESGPSFISYSFNDFVGEVIDDDMDELVDRL